MLRRIIPAALLLLVPTLGFAERLSLTSLHGASQFLRESAPSISGGEGVRAIAPVTARMKIAGLGRARVAFDREDLDLARRFSTGANPRVLQGTVTLVGGGTRSRFVASGVVRSAGVGRARLKMDFGAASIRGRKRFVHVTLGLSSDGPRVRKVSSVPASISPKLGCDEMPAFEDVGEKGLGDVVGIRATRSATIYIVATEDFISNAGGLSNAEDQIVTIANLNRLYYTRNPSDIGVIGEAPTVLDPVLGGQGTVADAVLFAGVSPADREDSNVVLDAFTTYQIGAGLPTANLYNLFDKPPGGVGSTYLNNVIGRAFLQAACGTFTPKTGITGFFANAAFTATIFTHELGHNFGSNHTAAGFMRAIADGDPDQEYFDGASRTQIANHVTCLPLSGGGGSGGGSGGGGGGSGGGPEPTATPTPQPTIDPRLPVPTATPTVPPTDGGPALVELSRTNKKASILVSFSDAPAGTSLRLQKRSGRIWINVRSVTVGAQVRVGIPGRYRLQTKSKPVRRSTVLVLKRR